MYTKDQLSHIAGKFEMKSPTAEVKPLGDGFINDTFIVTDPAGQPLYILQRKNKNIFTDVPAMMNNIFQVTEHLKKKIIAAGGDHTRESLTVTPAKDGALYYQDDNGEYWAMCDFIGDTKAYLSANTPYLCYQGGYGIGKFQSMLSDFTEPLTDILPGFHNIDYRFKQWDEVLKKDPAGRKKTILKEIEWIESRREKMAALWKLFEDGVIPRRVTHNDTKINNMLFDKNDKVMCVIDLDTVLSSIALNDFGDAIRSYTNTGLEDDPNLDNVSINMEFFRAYTEGYLSEAAAFLTPAETDNLAFSALYITYEQVLRFLMDYLDGDNYYKIKSPDHNLLRARAQYKLLQSMEENYDAMCEIVENELSKRL